MILILLCFLIFCVLAAFFIAMGLTSRKPGPILGGLALIALAWILVIGIHKAEKQWAIYGVNAYIEGRVVTDTLHTGEILYTFKNSNK